MKYLYRVLIFFCIIYFSPIKNSISSEKNNKSIKETNISNLKWEIKKHKEKYEKLQWNIISENKRYLSKKRKNKNYKYKVRAIGRSVKVNDNPYPEISNYVPNAFPESKNKFLTASLRGISKTRFCYNHNFSTMCTDGVLDIDFNLINTDRFSLNPKLNIQSLSNRGTQLGKGLSMGFKLAREISPKLSIALGGENIIHFDDSIDLGRNFYLMASTFYPLGQLSDSSFAFLNIGIGSDFYGYKGNGYLFKTSCLGQPNLTGEGTDFCNWGPIGSIGLAFNDRIALVNEWFGYGYGLGISFRPIYDKNLSLSFYATDFLKGLPSYAIESCPKNSCETRFYGSLSITY